ncbi:hypothetical protein OIU78_025512 [Salix suchowensis]|nr:hypothetical protein OIU78_025512 [Salix suchowensis]
MRGIVDAQCILRWTVYVLLLLLVSVFKYFIAVAAAASNKGIIISSRSSGEVYRGYRLDKANKMFSSARLEPLLKEGRMGNSSVAKYGKLISYWNGIDKAPSPGTPWQSHLEGLESAAAFDHLLMLFLLRH